MKVRNVIFSLILCSIMLGPAALFGLGYSNAITVPLWLSSEDSKWLTGGYEVSHINERFNLDAFRNGQLQSALEIEVGNNIPMKSAALLLNAGLQRGAIETSNALFGWECFPTFYGSNKLYIPEADALGRMPAKGIGSFSDSTNFFGRQLALFARGNPDISFNVVLADISEHSLLNPAYVVSTDVFTSVQSCDILQDACLEVDNVRVSFLQLGSLAEYYRNYYATDHHWNGFGAARAYALLTEEEAEFGSVVSGLSSIRMNGSSSREGLMLLNEPACEPRFDISHIEVQEENLPYALQQDGAYKITKNRKVAEFDFYHGWYGRSAPFEAGGPGEGRALIVCDSFGPGIQWLVINDHETTAVRFDLHVSISGDEKLSDILQETQCDEVYFVGHAGDFAHVLDRFPHYFE